MNKYFTFFILIAGLCILTSCDTLTGNGKATKAEEKGRTKVSKVEDKIASNTADKLDIIAGLSWGTDYSLSKINEPPREVTVARDMNQRIMTLSGSPTLEKIKEMQKTIDELTSILESERKDGERNLQIRVDAKVAEIQKNSKSLALEKDAEIRKYMDVAKTAAAKADDYKLQLDDYKGWMGLKAVGKGLWQFVTSMAWTLGIIGVVFLILRLAAGSNPAIGAVFSIFEMIGGWVLNAIQFILPKAAHFAGYVAKSLYDESALLLKKIVDNLQNLKDLQTKLGHDLTLKELFVELDKALDTKEKEAISKVKKELGY